MLFNSGTFLIFFPITVLIYFALPQKAKNIWLIISSYFYYMCWNPKYGILLFSCSLITFLSGLLLEQYSKTSNKKSLFIKKTIFILTLSLCTLVLFYYKYLNFSLHLLSKAFRLIGVQLEFPQFDIILPLGISFFTFQSLGYLIDVYRCDIPAEKNVIRYFLFISFFPQLLSGPIGRAKNLLHQFDQPKIFRTDLARDGLLTMLWGYFLKMAIADRCAIIVNNVYALPRDYVGIHLILANLFFTIQIYCDFMSYSTIARGAAKILGIDLIDNFQQPYFATSIRDFWRRWHISLSTWLRDYIYIPLGGSRYGKFRKYRNILITFFISGLWHGASLTFIAWGLIHGIYQITEDCLSFGTSKIISKLRIDTSTLLWRGLTSMKTFFLVSLAWIFFRADSLKDARYILKNSFCFDNLGLLFSNEIFTLGLNAFHFSVLLLAVIILFAVSVIHEKGTDIIFWVSQKKIIVRYLIYWGIIVIIIFSMNFSGQEFLYLQF